MVVIKSQFAANQTISEGSDENEEAEDQSYCNANLNQKQSEYNASAFENFDFNDTKSMFSKKSHQTIIRRDNLFRKSINNENFGSNEEKKKNSSSPSPSGKSTSDKRNLKVIELGSVY